MSVIRPFRAYRPARGYERLVAAPPYDVLSAEEARIAAEGNPYSFLRVDKAEICLDPSADPYGAAVYDTAAANLSGLIGDGVLIKDGTPRLYIYRLEREGRVQTGLVGCVSVDEYRSGAIRRHELTRADKESDRVRHVLATGAHTGPIFLTYKKRAGISDIISGYAAENAPEYDFTAADGVRHTVWVIGDANAESSLVAAFAEAPALYIADGHHRNAAAAAARDALAAANPNHTGDEEYNYYLAVAFPDDELYIMDYNRVVRALRGHDRAGFLREAGEKFFIEPSDTPVRPAERHTFGLYMNGSWRRMTAKPGTYDEADPIGSLDVSILQNNLLRPVLGIVDPRSDRGIDFIGGARGLSALRERVDAGWAAAFSMYPTSVAELETIADAGLVMPPKSTWFEPKLLSGLFIHKMTE
ncbi:MAG: DUF1015 family protein [Clostridiales bacterium]|jgi:uncharacterized protein (DUF1015 family)|nr:DUF1015 family protein [Clostridiales bacterium]